MVSAEHKRASPVGFTGGDRVHRGVGGVVGVQAGDGPADVLAMHSAESWGSEG